MKRMIGAAIMAAAAQGVFATACADENDRDRDRDRDREERRSHFFAGGGSIEDRGIEYDIPGGEVEIEADQGDVWTIGWGRRVGSRIRSETTFTYSEQEILSVRRTDGPIIQVYTPPGDVQVFSLTWMNYFDFASGAVRPYLGMGLGLSNVDLNDGVESGAGLAATGRLAVTLSGRDGVGGIVLKRQYRVDARDPAYTTELAAVVALRILEGRWKAIKAKGGVSDPSAPARGDTDLLIAVEFRGMSEWQEISRKLGAIPGVEEVEVAGLSARGARVTLRFMEGGERLADELAGRGLVLRNSGGNWVLSLR